MRWVLEQPNNKYIWLTEKVPGNTNASDEEYSYLLLLRVENGSVKKNLQ